MSTGQMGKAREGEKSGICCEDHSVDSPGKGVEKEGNALPLDYSLVYDREKGLSIQEKKG